LEGGRGKQQHKGLAQDTPEPEAKERIQEGRQQKLLTKSRQRGLAQQPNKFA